MKLHMVIALTLSCGPVGTLYACDDASVLSELHGKVAAHENAATHAFAVYERGKCVLDGIKSGARPWLDILPDLLRDADGADSEVLDVAVGDAIAVNPAGVFAALTVYSDSSSRSDEMAWTIKQVCSSADEDFDEEGGPDAVTAAAIKRLQNRISMLKAYAPGTQAQGELKTACIKEAEEAIQSWKD
jgi:hypothetical protein